MHKKYFIVLWVVLIILTTSLIFWGLHKKNNTIISFTISEYAPQSYGNNYTSGPYFIISGSTKQAYSCLMDINASTEVQNNIIKVTIEGTIDNISVGNGPGTICPSAIGPASLFEKLEIAEGEYALELYLKPETDKYKLVVTPEAIKVSKIKSSFSEIGKSKTIRTPRNIIAAHCFRHKYGCETGETPNEACPIFFSELEKIATPVDDISLTKGELGRCNKETYKKGECKFYRYDGDLKKLEELYSASNHYNLKYGYKAKCRDSNLYYKLIETMYGPTFSGFKCTVDESGNYSCIR